MKSVIEMGCGTGSNEVSHKGSRKKVSGSHFQIGNRAAIFARAASVLALAAICSLTACDNDYTLGYVYAPSETNTTSGLINAYGIDNQTGYLRLLADSPIPSGGRKPVAIAVSPSQKFVYVINHDDSDVLELSIGTDGKLYPQNTYNTTGSYPVALAVSADGKYLYIAYTYQVGYTTASPGPGGISIFPINSDNSLGTPVDFPIGRTPVAITVSSKPLSGGGNAVYVVSQDAAATNPASTSNSSQTLNLFAFAADASSGLLSTLPGETIVGGNVPSAGYTTGLAPGGIIEDASGTHLYITDSTGNTVIAYTIGADGVPAQLSNGVAATGSGPLGMAIDPSGTYLFVANSGSGTIGEYTFDSSGDPILSTVAASTQAGTGTNCVTVEPTHGVYVYASGLVSNSITGEQLITTGTSAGTLKPIINSPFAATTLPVCAVAVPRFP
jgi:6-phosphogluconolactonase (cycloisomerase 2 family)